MERFRGYVRLSSTGDPASAVGPARRRIGAALGATVILLSLLGLAQQLRPRAPLHGHPELLGLRPMASGESPVCNPLVEPGRMHWDRTGDRWRTRWEALGDRHCADAPDWFSLLRDAADPNDALAEARATGLSELQWLRNKTVLLLGDSVDRNALIHIAQLSNSNVYYSLYSDPSARNPDEQQVGWDARNLPHVTTIAPDALNLRIVNGFHYGLDDVDEFSYAADWHGPGRAEHRVTELFEPFARHLGKIDLIQLHSGMWDMAYWGRQDSRKDISTDMPLRTEQIDHWLSRMRSLIEHVRVTWPGTPVWLRTSHRVGGQFAHATWDFAAGIEHATNFFPDHRATLLRQMQLAAARDAGLPIFDFGLHWEGLNENADKVHPNAFPGGPIYANGLLHALWIETAKARNHMRPTPVP